MLFVRPQAPRKLTPVEKANLLRAYYDDCRRLADEEPKRLNLKVPREAFADFLDRIGAIVWQESVRLASEPGPVSDFLANNPLPQSLDGLLPEDFRAFCLALNALKQWVAAEQGATDRYLLGGTARNQCRAAGDVCVLSGTPLTPGVGALHHVARDGRPPIPLCKEAHAKLEGQSSAADGDPVHAKLKEIKGSRSWVQLRRGCRDLLGLEAAHSTPNVAASSRSFARKAVQETGMGEAELLQWLDDHDFGGD